MQVSLDHAHLFSSNVAATVDFLSRMFGATVVWDEETSGVRNVRLALGRAFIHLYDQPPKAARGGPVHHLGIETDDLDALVAHMKANGFEFRNAVRATPLYRYVMVAGPDDLLIELFETSESERWHIAR